MRRKEENKSRMISIIKARSSAIVRYSRSYMRKPFNTNKR